MSLSGYETMSTSASRAMIVSNAVMMALAGIAVVLRICVRKHKSRYLKADDYLIIAALVGLCCEI